MSTSKNKTMRGASVQKLVAGVQKHFAGATLALDGTSYTDTQLVTFAQERANATAAVAAAYAAWRNAVKDERAKLDETETVFVALRHLVLAMFGPDFGTLSDFGIEPRKRPTPTTEQLSKKLARDRATRAARHTLGAKEKAKIKGEVDATEPAIPPSPAPNGAPHP